jgi:hypothetical protein
VLPDSPDLSRALTTWASCQHDLPNSAEDGIANLICPVTNMDVILYAARHCSLVSMADSGLERPQRPVGPRLVLANHLAWLAYRFYTEDKTGMRQCGVHTSSTSPNRPFSSI